MHKTRLALALALGATALVGGVATAAPVKVCNQITDAAGDDGGPLTPANPTLDILTGDIASDAKTITAVLRLSAVRASDSNAPTGRSYYVDFSVPGGANPLWLGVTTTPTATNYSVGYVDGSLHRGLTAAGVVGVIDEAKKEIRISAPIGAWAERGLPKPGLQLSGIKGLSYYFVGAYVQTTGGGSLQPGDTAEGPRPYTAGAATCVVVGK